MSRETVIASFIMRFVKPAASETAIADTAVAGTAAAGPAGGSAQAGAAANPCRSEMRIAVRHVQSGYERRFARVEEAVAFIQKEIELLEDE
ncbi:MAG: hypothetical protein BWY85_02130 [Firmicutes bacterium ADurb.Bin506]|jgi:hypothetical protein|nr:MAG: hypothetical protein BWY85_02130 [Firmicutes bacterium ADurb.Bin506]